MYELGAETHCKTYMMLSQHINAASKTTASIELYEIIIFYVRCMWIFVGTFTFVIM